MSDWQKIIEERMKKKKEEEKAIELEEKLKKQTEVELEEKLKKQTEEARAKKEQPRMEIKEKSPKPKITPTFSKKDREEMENKLTSLEKDREEMENKLSSLEKDNTDLELRLKQLEEVFKESDILNTKAVNFSKSLREIASHIEGLDVKDKILVDLFNDQITKYKTSERIFEIDPNKLLNYITTLNTNDNPSWKSLIDRVKSDRPHYFTQFIDLINKRVLFRNNIKEFLTDETKESIIPLSLDPITLDILLLYLADLFEKEEFKIKQKAK